ncbi:MAG: cell division protein FtsA [Barnesiella sp.]|nr:cell division protein FtsA [Barnesiella sp.]MBD5330555.1 cell division protein FtsA [Bacteroides sp.]MBD5374777.1 cell division protein FtsA [Bacteroides sp.]MDE7461180.1 cell division protein FtsA [Paramuribaculum sp.]
MDDINLIAIEIGSSKIKGAIGSVDSHGILTVKAVEEMPLSESVRYGQLSNVAMAATTMRNIIQKIENRMAATDKSRAPRKVEKVYVAVGGRSLFAVTHEVNRSLPADSEVTPEIITALKREAHGAGVPERDVLCVEPREFIIDNTRADRPVGMYGSSIRMVANLIACRPQMKNNLPRLFEDKLKLKVNTYVVRQLAIADLVLSNDERKLGCMLVDFGAETTTVSVYKHGSLQYLATLPMGSRNITRDITALNCVEEDAENLKKNYGNAYPDSPSGTDDVKFTDLNNYISHRAFEIIKNIQKQLEYAGFTHSELPAGIIIVGGGAKLNGFNRRLEETTKLPVRQGNAVAQGVRIAEGRIAPADSVDVISILLHAAKNDPQECLSEPEPLPTDLQPEPEPEPEKPAKQKSGFLKDVWKGFRRAIIDDIPTDPDGVDLGDDEDA